MSSAHLYGSGRGDAPYTYGGGASTAPNAAVAPSSSSYALAGRRSNIVVGGSTAGGSGTFASGVTSNDASIRTTQSEKDRMYEELFGGGASQNSAFGSNNNNTSTNTNMMGMGPNTTTSSSGGYGSGAYPSVRAPATPSPSPQSHGSAYPSAYGYGAAQPPQQQQQYQQPPQQQQQQLGNYYDPNPQFGPIDASGLRSRTAKTSSLPSAKAVTTTDIISEFKTVLSPPPPKDSTSQEIEVFLNVAAARTARDQTLSPADGGYCRGARPPLTPAVFDTRQHSRYWITPVRGLRFVELDVEESGAVGAFGSLLGGGGDSLLGGGGGGGGGGANASSPIRHRVVRGTLLGYFGNDASSAPPTSSSDVLSPLPGRVAIWLPRGHTVSSVLDLSRARLLTAIRCKHCQGIVAQDESSYHLAAAHPERAVRSQQQQQQQFQLQPPPPPSSSSSSSQQQQQPQPQPRPAPAPYDPFRNEPPLPAPAGFGTAASPLPSSSLPFGGAPSARRNSNAPSPTYGYPSSSAAASASPSPAPSPGSAIPFGATQGSTYTTYFNQQQQPQPQQHSLAGSVNNGAGAGASPANGFNHFFGSPTAVAEAASSSSPDRGGGGGGGRGAAGAAVRSTRTYTIVAPGSGNSNSHSGGGGASVPRYAHRQSKEAFGEYFSFFESLSRSTKIGEGAQGIVSLCTTRDGNRLVVKDLEFPTISEAEECFRQGMQLNTLRHVHLISYLAAEWGSQAINASPSGSPFSPASASSDAYTYGGGGGRASADRIVYYVSILMPYYPDGDIARLIASGQRLEWYAIGSLGLQLASALVYLHTLSPAPVIHGDIKPDNVLLYSNKEQCVLMDLDTARECDLTRSMVARGHTTGGGAGGGIGGGGGAMGGFGFDSFMGGGGSARPDTATKSLRFLQSSPQKGTVEWMSPEGADGKKVTTRSDVWSLGLVLFAMATLPEFLMFVNPSTGHLTILNDKDWTAADLRAVLTSKLREARCPEALGEVILRMVVLDPERRYSSTDALLGLQYASERILLGAI